LVEQIPVIIDALVEALPVIIEVLADKAPEIIQAIVSKTDEIVLALVAAAPDIALALAQSMGVVALELTRSVAILLGAAVKGFGEKVLKGIVTGLRSVFEDIFQAFDNFFGPIVDAFQRFGNAVDSFVNAASGSSIAEGAKSAGGKVKDFFGLAKGGQVPAGFPGDTFPAALTSGELVIPPGDTARLSRFLDNQQPGQQQSGDSDAILMQILAAVQQPMTATAQAEVNGEVFADIILDLNRTNSRLT